MSEPEYDFIDIAVKLEFDQREDGWYSRIRVAHLISEWMGPTDTEKNAAAHWQKKLVALTEGRR